MITKFTFYGKIFNSHYIFSKGKIENCVVSNDVELVYVTPYGKQLAHLKFEEIEDEHFKIKCIWTTKNRKYEGEVNKKLNDHFFNYGINHKDITKITYIDSDFVIVGSFNKDYIPHGECTIYKNDKTIKGAFFNGITRYLGKLINYRCEILNAVNIE